MRPRNYVRDVLLKTDAWPGFEPQMAQFDEGFKLEFNPLLSLDGKVVDAVIRCEVDQIEKMIPVMIDVSTPAVRGQRTKIEVPQAICTRLHERFRWPTDQVLLISLGIGPAPVAAAPSTLRCPDRLRRRGPTCWCSSKARAKASRPTDDARARRSAMPASIAAAIECTSPARSIQQRHRTTRDRSPIASDRIKLSGPVRSPRTVHAFSLDGTS